MLLGPLSLDRYVDEGTVLPGGGILNMAFHWSRLGLPFELVSRIGHDRADLFQSFLRHHRIIATPDLVRPGRSASIDIRIGADRQPHMGNFVDGVGASFRMTDGEEDRVRHARHVHTVLVRSAADEVRRLHRAGRLAGVEASGDFLSLRRWTVEQFAAVMAALDVAFIGWPGAPDDPIIASVADVTRSLGRLLVVTLGSRGALVVDGRDGARSERFFPAVARPVTGTAVGCGDAFIAAFLAAWWTYRDIDGAVAAGAAAGAAAVDWRRPLPDEAYVG